MSDSHSARAAGSLRLRQAWRLVEKGLEAVTLTLFVVMLLAALGQVAFRYLLEIPVPWTEELARTLFVAAMFTGMAFAARDREHIVVDFLLVKYAPALRRVIECLFDLAILAFLVLWARGAIALAELNWTATLITIPWFSVGWLYLWELLGIALMALYISLGLWRKLSHRGPDGGGA